MGILQFLKTLFLGIVEGITEWLPISSTGHMLLVDEFLKLDGSDEFKVVFFVVIQLGAVMAVVLLFWNKLWPFCRKNPEKSGILAYCKEDSFLTWFKVALACVPGTAATLLFGDFIDAHLETPVVIAIMLIVYGVAFLFVEKGKKQARVTNLYDISWRDALIIGLFQVLSIIPGTSRSGATIVGALLIGISRTAAAEFTFFMAVPVMAGLSGVKLLKADLSAFTAGEWATMAVGSVVAFFVSLAVVKGLMNYIKKHDFSVFGWYRIALGAVVLLYFTLFR